MIYRMVLALKSGQMDQDMKGIIKKLKSMGKGRIFGQMGPVMKVLG